ncbi:MAG: DUF3025 domain-containing protein, partial [Candidatus Berkiella sp.]
QNGASPFWESLGYKLKEWPNIDDYNLLAKACQLSLCFIEQKNEMRYLWEIYHQGNIPTRTQSWHDFFNNLTWLIYPALKRAIVDKMCQDSTALSSRSSLQNTLAHFDECGVVICSSLEQHFELLKNHQWQQFFCDKNITQTCLPVIIGHGLMEKALKPYIGMTAKAVFLKVEPSFFMLPNKMKNDLIDQKMAQFILSEQFPSTPKLLHPFPLLGWPGWHDAQNEAFYANKQYFREKREICI